MKIYLLFYISWVLWGITCSNRQPIATKDSSIIMEYVGGFSDLPITTCIFHTEESYKIDTNILFGQPFQISEKEFVAIQRTIDHFSKPDQKIVPLDVYYSFKIRQDNQLKGFYVTKKAEALIILNKIMLEMDKNKNEKAIKEVLSDIIMRLP